MGVCAQQAVRDTSLIVREPRLSVVDADSNPPLLNHVRVLVTLLLLQTLHHPDSMYGLNASARFALRPSVASSALK